MNFAAEVKNSWDQGLAGTALADWCQHNPSSAAQMIERLRDQNSARLKIINDKLARIHDLEKASAVAPAPSACTTSHKVMTPEEYAAMPLQGWHEVCRDVDGFGGVGVRYLGVSERNKAIDFIQQATPITDCGAIGRRGAEIDAALAAGKSPPLPAPESPQSKNSPRSP